MPEGDTTVKGPVFEFPINTEMSFIFWGRSADARAGPAAWKGGCGHDWPPHKADVKWPGSLQFSLGIFST